MDSPPSSSSRTFRFRDSGGAILERPTEWAKGFVEILPPVEDPEQLVVLRNDTPLPTFKRELGGEWIVVAEWPLSGCGSYVLECFVGEDVARHTVRVAPAKLSEEQYEELIDQLQSDLPASIAVSLDAMGALAGITSAPLKRLTIPEELQRLRLAVQGSQTADSRRPGLSQLLPTVQRDPYRMLQKDERWVDRRKVRMPEVAALSHALARASNLDEGNRPLRVVDARVRHTVDLAENRLVKAYGDQVDRRLRRLRGLCVGRTKLLQVLGESEGMLKDLRSARRAAPFLDEVSEMRTPPSRPSMVLLRRPEYRAALEGFLELNRSLVVALDDPLLEAPLENLPRLYEIWGVLVVIQALLDVAQELGYSVRTQSLVRRHLGDSVFVKLQEGSPAIELERADGTQVRLTAQRSFSKSRELRSISFSQIPDVAVEIHGPAETAVVLFDPKYKLDSERLAAQGVDASVIDGEDAELNAVPLGQPKKVDIDKMHAYRDAIRDESGNHVVRYAAIMYPGPDRSFQQQVEALSSIPGNQAVLREHIASILRTYLT